MENFNKNDKECLLDWNCAFPGHECSLAQCCGMYNILMDYFFYSLFSEIYEILLFFLVL